jgi:hypothetical protein
MLLAAGCAVAPDPSATSTTSDELQAASLPGAPTHTANDCQGICLDTEFYCPANPELECSPYCAVLCAVCDDGTEQCFDEPPPG